MLHAKQTILINTYPTPPASTPMSIPSSCSEHPSAGSSRYHAHPGRFYESSYISELGHMSPDKLYRHGRTSISSAGTAPEAEGEASTEATTFITRKIQEKFVAMLHNESLEALVQRMESPSGSPALGELMPGECMAVMPMLVSGEEDGVQSGEWRDDVTDVKVQEVEVGMPSEAVIALWVQDYHRSLCMYHARWLLNRQAK